MRFSAERWNVFKNYKGRPSFPANVLRRNFTDSTLEDVFLHDERFVSTSTTMGGNAARKKFPVRCEQNSVSFSFERRRVDLFKFFSSLESTIFLALTSFFFQSYYPKERNFRFGAKKISLLINRNISEKRKEFLNLTMINLNRGRTIYLKDEVWSFASEKRILEANASFVSIWRDAFTSHSESWLFLWFVELDTTKKVAEGIANEDVLCRLFFFLSSFLVRSMKLAFRQRNSSPANDR